MITITWFETFFSPSLTSPSFCLFPSSSVSLNLSPSLFCLSPFSSVSFRLPLSLSSLHLSPSHIAFSHFSVSFHFFISFPLYQMVFLSFSSLSFPLCQNCLLKCLRLFSSLSPSLLISSRHSPSLPMSFRLLSSLFVSFHLSSYFSISPCLSLSIFLHNSISLPLSPSVSTSPRLTHQLFTCVQSACWKFHRPSDKINLNESVTMVT